MCSLDISLLCLIIGSFCLICKGRGKVSKRNHLNEKMKKSTTRFEVTSLYRLKSKKDDDRCTYRMLYTHARLCGGCDMCNSIPSNRTSWPSRDKSWDCQGRVPCSKLLRFKILRRWCRFFSINSLCITYWQYTLFYVLLPVSCSLTYNLFKSISFIHKHWLPIMRHM